MIRQQQTDIEQRQRKLVAKKRALCKSAVKKNSAIFYFTTRISSPAKTSRKLYTVLQKTSDFSVSYNAI